MLSSDQILDQLGSSNGYLLFIWISSGVVWSLTAMPMMVTAFIIGGKCEVLENGNDSASCVPHPDSMIYEFDLTGSRALLAEQTASVFSIGWVIGSVILPPLSDIKGRRFVLLLSMASYGFVGCLSSLAPNIYVFAGIRFLQGHFFCGANVPAWSLAYESVPTKLRSYTAMVFGLMWVLGYCLVAPLAFYLPNWRHLMVAVSFPMLVASVVYYFTIPNSLHYLASRKKSGEVRTWLQKAEQYSRKGSSRIGAVEVEDYCKRLDVVAAEIAAEKSKCGSSCGWMKKSSLLHHLMNNGTLLHYTLVFIYLWTCDNSVYFGLSLFSTQLAGDKYINYAILGLVEIPSQLISPLLLNKMGRRSFVTLCHFVTSLTFFVTLFSDKAELSIAMWLLGKFAISCCSTSIFVYASEVFPTVVRSGCVGICTTVAGLGGVFAPTVRALALINPNIPTIFFGSIAILATGLVLTLPETLNRELPEEVEKMARSKLSIGKIPDKIPPNLVVAA